MIRRYIRRMRVSFSLAGESMGASEIWVGIEIDCDEEPPDGWLEEMALEPAAGISDEELRRRGVTTWSYMAIGDPAAN